MAVVPVIMNSLHHDVMRGRKDRLGELWVPICSSAMFDPQVMLDMAEHGMFVVQTYGSTETCGDGIINYAQDAKHIGAVGQGNDYLDYKIAEDGELCMHGDSIMLGYYKDPEATAEVIDADGWFHTGDLARKDEDGYYFLTGRKKNLIILDSGENISPKSWKHRGQVRSREGMCCKRNGQEDRRGGLLRRGQTAAGAGLYHRGKPHPAAVQAYECSGVQHRAAAAQRCRQAAAPVIQMRSNARMHKWAGRPAD